MDFVQNNQNDFTELKRNESSVISNLFNLNYNDLPKGTGYNNSTNNNSYSLYDLEELLDYRNQLIENSLNLNYEVPSNNRYQFKVLSIGNFSYELKATSIQLNSIYIKDPSFVKVNESIINLYYNDELKYTKNFKRSNYNYNKEKDKYLKDYESNILKFIVNDSSNDEGDEYFKYLFVDYKYTKLKAYKYDSINGKWYEVLIGEELKTGKYTYEIIPINKDFDINLDNFIIKNNGYLEKSKDLLLGDIKYKAISETYNLSYNNINLVKSLINKGSFDNELIRSKMLKDAVHVNFYTVNHDYSDYCLELSDGRKNSFNAYVYKKDMLVTSNSVNKSAFLKNDKYYNQLIKYLKLEGVLYNIPEQIIYKVYRCYDNLRGKGYVDTKSGTELVTLTKSIDGHDTMYSFSVPGKYMPAAVYEYERAYGNETKNLNTQGACLENTFTKYIKFDSQENIKSGRLFKLSGTTKVQNAKRSYRQFGIALDRSVVNKGLDLTIPDSFIDFNIPDTFKKNKKIGEYQYIEVTDPITLFVYYYFLDSDGKSVLLNNNRSSEYDPRKYYEFNDLFNNSESNVIKYHSFDEEDILYVQFKKNEYITNKYKLNTTDYNRINYSEDDYYIISFYVKNDDAESITYTNLGVPNVYKKVDDVDRDYIPEIKNDLEYYLKTRNNQGKYYRIVFIGKGSDYKILFNKDMIIYNPIFYKATIQKNKTTNVDECYDFRAPATKLLYNSEDPKLKVDNNGKETSTYFDFLPKPFYEIID